MQSNKKINFVFWGTPDVASETLEILKENGYMPSLIITAPDKPQGRKMLITPPPAKVWAIKNNIPYIQPMSFSETLPETRFTGNSRKPGFREIEIESDINIVVAYGKIIPEDIINLPKFGSINIHYSLLPKYRGASPVESAILNGDGETGVTIQKMEYKMDTGPIIALEKVKIGPDEKAGELRKRLIKIGGELLVKTLKTYTPTLLPLAKGEVPKAEGVFKLTPQDESKATYCKKIKKEDGLIDLTDDPIKNYNKFRAYSTWPRTYFFLGKKRIIITDATLENNLFVIKKIIPEGGKETKYNN